MPKIKNLPVYIFVFLIGFFVTYLLLTLFYPLNGTTAQATIHVSGLWEKNVFAAIKDEFIAEHPEVTVIYDQRSPEQYYSNLKAGLSSGKQPDVFWMDSAWTPVLASYLDPIPSSVFSASEFEKTFYPVAKTDMKLNGKYVGLPLEIDGLALLYNKDTLSAKNFSLPPRTWTSLRSTYVPSLTAIDKDRLVSAAVALGATNNVENLSDIIGLFLLQNGVTFTQNGKLILNSSKDAAELAASALNFYFSFAKSDKTWDNTQPDSLEAFARGKVAMAVLPAYKIHQLLAYLKQNSLTLNFGVEPVPQLPSAPTVTWGRYWALGVNKNSSSRKASWEFAKFVLEPDTLKKVEKLQASADGFGRSFPRMEMAQEQSSNVYLAPYLSQAKFAKSWYLHSDTFEDGLNDPVIAELKKALVAIDKGDGPESALKSFSAAVEPILNKYGITRADDGS